MSNLCTKVSNDGETMRRRGERDRADAESKPQQKTEKKTMRRGMAGRKPIGESPPPPREQTTRPAVRRKKERRGAKRSFFPFSRVFNHPPKSRHFRPPRVPWSTSTARVNSPPLFHFSFNTVVLPYE